MVYNLASRFDYLGKRMPELNQNTLSLSREGEVTVIVNNFTPELTDVEALAVFSPVVLTEEMQDFVFDLSEYSAMVNPYPEVGDTIVWGSLTFEVMTIDGKNYKYTTSSRLRVRIHTKKVA